MGDLYLAEDLSLTRKVALKILPPEFADHVERGARFAREAKVVAALNHPTSSLTTDPTPDWSPRWSPNAQEIAFYSYRSGNRDIWLLPSRCGPARQLSSHPGQDWYPSWSPDGREIAFQSRGQAAIMIVDTEGGEPRTLAAAGDDIPEWSPDATWLVVKKPDAQLYRVATKDGEAVSLPVKGEHQPFTTRVSRDGQSIFYSITTGPPDTHLFWRLSLADGAVSRLTRLEGRRGNIGDNFSTDGRHLYFTWREDDGDIWIMMC